MLENIQSLTMTLAAACPIYRFVKLANAGKITPAAAATDDAVGIVLEGRTAQEITDGKTAVNMAQPGGKCYAEAGAAISISGAVVPLTTDSVGRAVAVAAATDRIYGYALTAAGAAGEYVEILFIKGADRRDA